MNRVEIAFAAEPRPELVYAAEELLRPLGLAVRVREKGRREERRVPGLHVGPDPPEGAVHVPEADLQTVFGWLSGARERATPERDRGTTCLLLTAAHQPLPFGTQVRVTNLNNGLSVTVRINDRGPFVGRRIIDLSRRAAERIDMIGSGTAPVRLEILNSASGAPVSFRTGVDRTLRGYSVMSANHKLGTLLLLNSSAVSRPLLVRVVANRVPEGVDMMVSQALYAQLGEEISVVTP